MRENDDGGDGGDEGGDDGDEGGDGGDEGGKGRDAVLRSMMVAELRLLLKRKTIEIAGRKIHRHSHRQKSRPSITEPLILAWKVTVIKS